MGDLLNLLKAGDLKGLAKLGISGAEAQSLIRAVKPLSNSASTATKTSVVNNLTKMMGTLTSPVQGMVKGLLGSLSAITNTFSTGIKTIVDGSQGNIDETLGSLNSMGANFIDDLTHLNLFKGITDIITLPVEQISKGIANAYAAEINARETVNKELNITGLLSDKYRDTIVDSYKNTILLGGEFKDIHEIVNGIANNLGVSRMLGSETISDIFTAQKALGVNNSTIGEAAAGFEDVSIGISSTAKELTKAGNNARNVGLKVNDYIKKLTDNLTLVNQYGFKNGIDGLERMLRTSQSLRINMSDMTAIADKVWNPEGALEMVANLQAVGGAFGSFMDPMKLVYQATNDMEGLQESLIGAAKSLAHFNQETGKFEISAINKRRAKDMADAIGYPVKEFENLAIRAAQKGKALQEINLLGGTFSGEEKEFLSNISEMKNGRIQISLPEEELKQFGSAVADGAVIVSKLNHDQVVKLKEIMADREKESKDPIEIANQQLSTQKTIELMLKQLLTKAGITVTRDENVRDFNKKIRLSGDKQKIVSEKGEDSVMQIVELIKKDGLSTDPAKLGKIIKDLFNQVMVMGQKPERNNEKIQPQNNNTPKTIPVKQNSKIPTAADKKVQPIDPELKRPINIKPATPKIVITPPSVIKKTLPINPNSSIDKKIKPTQKIGTGVEKPKAKPINPVSEKLSIKVKSETPKIVMTPSPKPIIKKSFDTSQPVIKKINQTPKVEPVEGKKIKQDAIKQTIKQQPIDPENPQNKKTNKEDKSTSMNEKKITVDINIKGSTVYDDITRNILRDATFIHDLKEALTEQNFS